MLRTDSRAGVPKAAGQGRQGHDWHQEKEAVGGVGKCARIWWRGNEEILESYQPWWWWGGGPSGRWWGLTSNRWKQLIFDTLRWFANYRKACRTRVGLEDGSDETCEQSRPRQKVPPVGIIPSSALDKANSSTNHRQYFYLSHCSRR